MQDNKPLASSPLQAVGGSGFLLHSSASSSAPATPPEAALAPVAVPLPVPRTATTDSSPSSGASLRSPTPTGPVPAPTTSPAPTAAGRPSSSASLWRATSHDSFRSAGAATLLNLEHRRRRAQQQPPQQRAARASTAFDDGDDGGVVDDVQDHGDADKGHEEPAKPRRVPRSPPHAPQGLPLPLSMATPRHSPARSLGLRALAEFYGTFVFLFLALGGVQAALTRGQAPALEIALCFGLGLAAAIGLTFRVSGGALNPAVCLGLAAAGAMPASTAVAYAVAQCAGALAACGVVAALFDGPNGRSFAGANGIQTLTDAATGATVPACTLAQAVFIEALLTMGLVLTVLFQAVEKHRATFMAPLSIGLYVFVAHLVSLPYTNTSINPARSLGAAAIAGVWTNHWVFWLGPALGAAAAALVHRSLVAVDYAALNPGQDADCVADPLLLHTPPPLALQQHAAAAQWIHHRGDEDDDAHIDVVVAPRE
ncbi:hypothetical protein HK405_012618 [Cladochytrium tenue]|nr:hypothetical protein HK405_012618 [Cladochytrium tenue]